jgi:SAM-dependent methyltransferase
MSHQPTTTTVERVYRERFSEEEAAAKTRAWRELARYLQRFVPADSIVLDIACDRGDFINNIQAKERWGSDIRDMSRSLLPGVHFARADGLELEAHVPNGYFDVAFMSNYLEHLPSGETVVRQLEVVTKLLKPGGRVIVLQPNIRLVGPAYWDFIDHSVALTERSLVEAGELCGFETEHLIKRFLPYTTKGRLPVSPFLLRAYLAFRPAWMLLGKQTLYVARHG